MSADPALPERWATRLRDLADRIRAAARATLCAALARGESSSIDRPVAQGEGDLSFGLDRPAEEALDRWLRETARLGPLSLLSEEAGWRHLGPPARAGGEPVALPDFDHGGPRIVVDPVDGTRNWMADLRSAWTAIALCPPGRAAPCLAEVRYGLLAELPDSRAALYRLLEARAGGGARIEERQLTGGTLVRARSLRADRDDRPDHGYFPFFCYAPAMRPEVAALAADFVARLAREEGCDARHVYDDQYISNAGQLALLALGTYRMVADLRPLFAERCSGPHTSSKAYDCAAAILVAREAGCRLRTAFGEELDFPLDARSPVSFVGYANEPTRARLEPHLLRALSARALGAPR